MVSQSYHKHLFEFMSILYEINTCLRHQLKTAFFIYADDVTKSDSHLQARRIQAFLIQHVI